MRHNEKVIRSITEIEIIEVTQRDMRHNHVKFAFLFLQ